MKKIVLIFFALLFCLGVNAQSADLYDANFDAPRNIPSYDENSQVFQDIYLQYEEAIHRSEESIRSEEKSIYSQELTKALEKQKQEIYAKEIDQLRKGEYENLSTELHDVISKELTEKFAAEYEKKLKEESDKLAQEYESKIAEYERQKNSEMKAWIKENKKQALEETNARTERMRILTPYIVAVIAAAAIILLCWLLAKVIIKNKHEKNARQKQLDARNQQIEIYKAEYLNRLKRVGSSNIYRDEIKNIYEEINDSQESDAIKTLRKEAVQQADKEFDSSRITSSIAEYRKIFDGLNPKRHFNTWNTLGDDIETKKAVIPEFLANIAEYEKYAISACNSKNDQTEIANMLKPYVPVLKSNSEQLASMKDSESDESLKEQLSDLSAKYQELADKFNKGKF